MSVRTRDHVSTLTVLLSGASLALVFGAVLGVIPSSRLPHAPNLVAVVPHLNVAVSLSAIGAIAVGWRAIRRGRVRRHRVAMIAAAVLFATFLLLYLYRVTLEGPAPFHGPETLYRFVYLPLLAIHVTLAVVCVPLLYYVLLVGLTHPVPTIARTRHAAVGRIAASLWVTSFVLGIAVYLLLYVAY